MKSIEVTNTSIGFFKHVNFTYNLVPFTWQQLECYYEFDDLYPVIIKNTGVSVKEQFKVRNYYDESKQC